MKKLLLFIGFTCISYGLIAKNDANCPKGTYLDKCDECSFDSNTKMLTCKKCKDNKGNTHQSTLQILVPDGYESAIWNEDGKLQYRYFWYPD